jgi:uncharacterized protein (TIGR02246 family)
MQSHHSAEDETAIKKVVMEMIEKFNQHDAKAMASLFAKDGDLVNVYGTWLKDQAAIEDGLSGMFVKIVPTATLKTLDMEVRFIRPDVAIAHVTNEFSEPSGILTDKNQYHTTTS